MDSEHKILIQCDFDGTVTEEDVSFALLDTHASGDWRNLLEEYKEGRINVGEFNSQAFSMIKADKRTLLETSLRCGKVRAGFSEFIDYCRGEGFRFVIVSNGLDFYIEKILQSIKLGYIEIFSSKTRFNSGKIEVNYIGPEGTPLMAGFKDAHVRFFQGKGYRVLYVGDGFSDISPAKQCHHIFATSELLSRCREMNLECTSFANFYDVRRGIEGLQARKAL